MRSSRSLILAAGLVGCLAVALALPPAAWSQFSGGFNNTGTTSFTRTLNVRLADVEATSNTIAGPGAFTEDRNNPDQNVIYEVFGAAAVNVCMTLQNRGRQGDVTAVVDGAPIDARVRPRRTRTLCFDTPSSIELSCSTSLCDALWRIDAI